MLLIQVQCTSWILIAIIYQSDFLLFIGRGRHSHAYTHSVQVDHHVFLNLHTLKVCKNSLMKLVSKLSVALQFIRLAQCTNLCSFGNNTLTVCTCAISVYLTEWWNFVPCNLWHHLHDRIHVTYFCIRAVCWEKINNLVGCPKALKL